MPKKLISKISNKARKQYRNRERLKLPHGCECTQPYISPANWKDANASIKGKWKLRFTFYDPILCPGGKPISWEGMNGQKTLLSRQAVAEQLLNNLANELPNG